MATIGGADDYFRIGQNLFLGNGFSADIRTPFSASVLRPPLYPFLIAGANFLFRTYWAFLVIQVFISSLIPVLGYRLAKKIINSGRVSFLTGLFLVLEPHGAALSYVFMTETVFIFLFFLCLNYLFEYLGDYELKNLALASLLLGLTVLTRPVAQFLPFIIGLFILWHFRKNIKIALGHLLLLTVVFVLVISPWLYRNYGIYKTLGLTSQTAYNFYTYLVPSVLSIEHNTPYAEEKEKILEPLHFDNDVITLANSNHFLQKSWEMIKKYPGSILESFAITVATFFSHDKGAVIILNYLGVSSDYHFPGLAIKTLFKSPVNFLMSLKQMLADGGLPLFFILAARLFWIMIAGLSLLGIVRLYKDSEKKLTSRQLISIFLVFYFAFVSAINGLGINARFRLPVEMFIFVFAVYFVFGYTRAIRSPK